MGAALLGIDLGGCQQYPRPAPAWEQIAERFGARRAAWVIRQITPTNLTKRPGTPPAFPNPGPLKADAWTLPAQARLLPDRWVVHWLRGRGTGCVLEVGAPIPEQLPVSLAPDRYVCPPADDETLSIDAGMRWMVDFDEAERLGMAVRVLLPAVGAAPLRLNRLLVFGIKSKLSAANSATIFEDQLNAQHFTRRARHSRHRDAH